MHACCWHARGLSRLLGVDGERGRDQGRIRLDRGAACRSAPLLLPRCCSCCAMSPKANFLWRGAQPGSTRHACSRGLRLIACRLPVPPATGTACPACSARQALPLQPPPQQALPAASGAACAASCCRRRRSADSWPGDRRHRRQCSGRRSRRCTYTVAAAAAAAAATAAAAAPGGQRPYDCPQQRGALGGAGWRQHADDDAGAAITWSSPLARADRPSATATAASAAAEPAGCGLRSWGPRPRPAAAPGRRRRHCPSTSGARARAAAGRSSSSTAAGRGGGAAAAPAVRD